MLKVKIKDKKRRVLLKQHEIDKLIFKQIFIFSRFVIRNLVVFDKTIFLKQIISNNASIARFKNICILTSRSRGIFHDFSISRHELKKVGSFGLIPGLRKSSW